MYNICTTVCFLMSAAGFLCKVNYFFLMFSFQSPFLVCSPWNVIYSFTVWEYIILFSYDGWGGWSSKPKEIHNLFFKNQQATFGILIQIK